MEDISYKIIIEQVPDIQLWFQTKQIAYYTKNEQVHRFHRSQHTCWVWKMKQDLAYSLYWLLYHQYDSWNIGMACGSLQSCCDCTCTDMFQFEWMFQNILLVLCRCDSASCRSVEFSCRIVFCGHLMVLVEPKDELSEHYRFYWTNQSTNN